MQAIQNMRQKSPPTDAWKPFLKLVECSTGLTPAARDAIARTASKVIAKILTIALEMGTGSSDDSPTLLSVTLKGLPDGNMEVDYQAFGEWLADRFIDPKVKTPPSAWIKHCIHVLYNLLQHSFFACKNINRHHTYRYGFGPRDLVKNDIVVDLNAPSWKQGGNSMGFAIHDLDFEGDETYRLVGSCWILGEQNYDIEPREYHLAMLHELLDFLDRKGGASRTSELKEKVLQVRDRLLGRLLPNSV